MISSADSGKQRVRPKPNLLSSEIYILNYFPSNFYQYYAEVEATQVPMKTHFPHRSISKNHSSMQWKLD